MSKIRMVLRGTYGPPVFHHAVNEAGDATADDEGEPHQQVVNACRGGLRNSWAEIGNGGRNGRLVGRGHPPAGASGNEVPLVWVDVPRKLLVADR